MSSTKEIANTVATLAASTATLAIPAVVADAAIGTAFWQSPPPHPTVCSEYGCADCDALAVAAALDSDADITADVDALDDLLAMSDAELDALDAYLDADTVPFADGLGLEWPGTDWDQDVPF